MNFDSAIAFMYSIGIDDPINVSEHDLVQHIAVYLDSTDSPTSDGKKAQESYRLITGKDLRGSASKFGVPIALGEGRNSRKPRRRGIARAKKLGMETMDSLLQTTLECSGMNVDSVGKVTIIKPESIDDIISSDMSDESDDFSLDATWFEDAYQDMFDRATTGEKPIKIVHDLSLRFAGFFDGNINAFEFAAAAFSRKMLAVGMLPALYESTESPFPLIMYDGVPISFTKLMHGDNMAIVWN